MNVQVYFWRYASFGVLRLPGRHRADVENAAESILGM